MFLVFLKSAKGDFLGILRFLEDHIHFKPVDIELIGIFDYKSNDDVTQGDHYEFKVSYIDLLMNENSRTRLSEIEHRIKEEGKMNDFNIVLELGNNGWYQACNHQQRSFLNKFRKRGFSLVSVSLKVRGRTLVGQKLGYEKTKAKAEKIMGLIESYHTKNTSKFPKINLASGKKAVDLEKLFTYTDESEIIPITYDDPDDEPNVFKKAVTSVGMFDIKLENILPGIQFRTGSKLVNIQRDIYLLKDMLGIFKLKTIMGLKNQSSAMLSETYSEVIGGTKEHAEMIDGPGGAPVDEVEARRGPRRNTMQIRADEVNWVEGNKELIKDYQFEFLVSKSSIISCHSGFDIKRALPGIYQEWKWKKLFDVSQDGTSYKS